MADESEFKTGDVVVLKSGSPCMTVQAVAKDQATCVWFHDGSPKVEAFRTAMLKPYVAERVVSSGPMGQRGRL